jgi:hypothetical protein
VGVGVVRGTNMGAGADEDVGAACGAGLGAGSNE